MGNMLWHSKDNAGRGPSGGLWGSAGGCPWDDIVANPNIGYWFEDDFQYLETAKYTATQATAGTFALGDEDGGVAIANSGATTATQGINVQLGGTAGESVLLALGRKLWFESRIRFTASSTGPEFFLGFRETDTTIIASSALTAGNMLGISSVTDNNVLLLTGDKATAELSVAYHTMVDATNTKVGFVVEPISSTALQCTGFVNGVETATKLEHANIPLTELRLSLVCQSGGTTQPTVVTDWWRYAVLFAR